MPTAMISGSSSGFPRVRFSRSSPTITSACVGRVRFLLDLKANCSCLGVAGWLCQSPLVTGTLALLETTGDLRQRKTQLAESSCEESQALTTVFVRGCLACGLELFPG